MIGKIPDYLTSHYFITFSHTFKTLHKPWIIKLINIQYFTANIHNKRPAFQIIIK